jgi:tetratricopeptide (TPR) repeat protein
VIAADPEWMDLAAAAGHEVRAVSALTHRELRGAEAVVVRAADAWARLRTWRLGGLSVGVVVVDERGDSPDDRTRLEPVVVLRRRDRPGFVEALERLRVGEAPARVVLATGTADFHRQVFERVDGTLVHLTGLEARLLAYLAARSFRVVGRDELQEQVWGYRRSMPTKAVEASVGRLRKKVEQDSLVTIRGEGYRAVRVAPPREVGSPSLQALRAAVTLLVQHGRPDEARGMLAQLERDRAPDDVRTLAEGKLLRARLLQEGLDREAALREVEGALALADEHGWPALAAEACCTGASLLRLLGQRALAVAWADRAEALFGAAGDEVGTARALAIRSELAPPAEGLLLAARAVALLDRADLAERFGLAAFALRATLRTRLGTAYRREGRREEALVHYLAAAQAFTAQGRSGAAGEVLAAVGTLRAELGDDAGAERAFAEALAAAPTGTRPVVDVSLARFALGQGRFEQAYEHASHALAGVGDPSAPQAVWVTLTMAEAALALGDLEQARAWFGRAHPGSDSPQHDAEALRARLAAALAPSG